MLRFQNIENPMIAEMERHNNELYGSAVVCPLCECDCETIYLDDNNNVASCDNCFLDSFTKIDAADWKAKEDEAKEYERF